MGKTKVGTQACRSLSNKQTSPLAFKILLKNHRIDLRWKWFETALHWESFSKQTSMFQPNSIYVNHARETSNEVQKKWFNKFHIYIYIYAKIKLLYQRVLEVFQHQLWCSQDHPWLLGLRTTMRKSALQKLYEHDSLPKIIQKLSQGKQSLTDLGLQ